MIGAVYDGRSRGSDQLRSVVVRLHIRVADEAECSRDEFDDVDPNAFQSELVREFQATCASSAEVVCVSKSWNRSGFRGLVDDLPGNRRMLDAGSS